MTVKRINEYMNVYVALFNGKVYYGSSFISAITNAIAHR